MFDKRGPSIASGYQVCKSYLRLSTFNAKDKLIFNTGLVQRIRTGKNQILYALM